MNYRHVYHAGNHADVLKHAILALALERFKAKDKPFRMIDAHAGIALYRLDAPEAGKTNEWREGLGRLFGDDATPLPLHHRAEAALAPWRAAVVAANPPGHLACYPGSPEVARTLMRDSDHLTANELHPEDAATLRSAMARDRRVTVTSLDAVHAVKASLPPPERRGLVLIDPPYEQRNDTTRALMALREGFRRFATGTFILWYPVTGDSLSDQVVMEAKALDLPRTLDVRLMVRKAVRQGGLAGSGLVVVNPPFTLTQALDALLPPLAERLRQSEGFEGRWSWLVPERTGALE